MSKSHLAYHEIGVSTEIQSATPHRLVQMLFERCLTHLNLSKAAIQEKNYSMKMHSIAKANDIIRYLRDCLQREASEAKKMVQMFDETYDFIEISLIRASLENDIKPINQSIQVLTNIKDGWDGITPA